MALHVDENGIGAVTPNYLFHQNGTVPHPLQLAGILPHLSNGAGGGEIHRYANGNPFFDRFASLISGMHK
jgi:hypothetical protein